MIKIQADAIRNQRLAHKAIKAVLLLPVGQAYEITGVGRGVGASLSQQIKHHGLGRHLTATERKGKMYLFKTGARWWNARGQITLLTHKRWGRLETFPTR